MVITRTGTTTRLLRYPVGVVAEGGRETNKQDARGPIGRCFGCVGIITNDDGGRDPPIPLSRAVHRGPMSPPPPPRLPMVVLSREKEGRDHPRAQHAHLLSETRPVVCGEGTSTGDPCSIPSFMASSSSSGGTGRVAGSENEVQRVFQEPVEVDPPRVTVPRGGAGRSAAAVVVVVVTGGGNASVGVPVVVGVHAGGVPVVAGVFLWMVTVVTAVTVVEDAGVVVDDDHGRGEQVPEAPVPEVGLSGQPVHLPEVVQEDQLEPDAPNGFPEVPVVRPPEEPHLRPVGQQIQIPGLARVLVVFVAAAHRVLLVVLQRDQVVGESEIEGDGQGEGGSHGMTLGFHPDRCPVDVGPAERWLLRGRSTTSLLLLLLMLLMMPGSGGNRGGMDDAPVKGAFLAGAAAVTPAGADFSAVTAAAAGGGGR